ncbi:MAG: helix-turn-helix transcriptional regulator [Pseudomonadota bacterium]
MAITTVAELVRTARNGRSQKDFARELGVRQSSVSRYESLKGEPAGQSDRALYALGAFNRP